MPLRWGEGRGEGGARAACGRVALWPCGRGVGAGGLGRGSALTWGASGAARGREAAAVPPRRVLVEAFCHCFWCVLGRLLCLLAVLYCFDGGRAFLRTHTHPSEVLCFLPLVLQTARGFRPSESSAAKGSSYL